MDSLTLRLEIEKKVNIFSGLQLDQDIFGNSEDELLVAALDLILTVSKKMNLYNDDKNSPDINVFKEMEYLKNNKTLISTAEKAFSVGALGILRYATAQKFMQNEIKNEDELFTSINQFKEAFKNKDKDKILAKYFNEKHTEVIEYIEKYDRKDPYRNWGAIYRHMLPFVYDAELKNKIWQAIMVLRDRLLKDLRLENSWESKNSQGWYNHARSYYGFEGPSNYGIKNAALMLHPKDIPDHKNSIELVCYFINGNIQAGIDIGYSLIEKNKDLASIRNLKFFNPSPEYQLQDLYNNILDYLKENKHSAIKQNQMQIEKNNEICKIEIAEADAEYSDNNELNLYDNTENSNAENSNFENSDFETEKAPQIKAIGEIKETKIEPNIKDSEDYLNKRPIANYLADSIIRNKDIEPLNIGIFGGWGSGKSHLFGLIKHRFNEYQSKKLYEVEIIDFDAWQYNNWENIWASLVMKIMEKAKSKKGFYIEYIIFNKLLHFIKDFKSELFYRSIFMFIILAIIAGLYNFFDFGQFDFLDKIFWVKIVILSIIAAIFPSILQLKFINIDKTFSKCFEVPKYTEQIGFKSEIRKLISFAVDFLTQGPNKLVIKNRKITIEKTYNKRLVLFIDNLDRCSSSNIKQILDSICQFLQLCCDNNCANVIVLFAIDRNIIINALQQEGIPKEKAHQYFEKIINLPIYINKEENIQPFINRLFGEGGNKIKNYLLDLHKKRKILPRRLANLRYLCDACYGIFKTETSENETRQALFY